MITEAGFFHGVPDGVMALVLDRVTDGPAGQAGERRCEHENVY